MQVRPKLSTLCQRDTTQYVPRFTYWPSPELQAAGAAVLSWGRTAVLKCTANAAWGLQGSTDSWHDRTQRWSQTAGTPLAWSSPTYLVPGNLPALAEPLNPLESALKMMHTAYLVEHVPDTPAMNMSAAATVNKEAPVCCFSR